LALKTTLICGRSTRDKAGVDLDSPGSVKTKMSIHSSISMVADAGQPEEAGKQGGPGGEVNPGESYRVTETWSRDVEVKQRGRNGTSKHGMAVSKDGVDKDSCAMDICGVEARENIKVENLEFDKMYRGTEEQVICIALP
jgi:hypothetical protein